jgi:hypothetical protein
MNLSSQLILLGAVAAAKLEWLELRYNLNPVPGYFEASFLRTKPLVGAVYLIRYRKATICSPVSVERCRCR